MPHYDPNPTSRNSHFEPLLTTASTDTGALTPPADATTAPAADRSDSYHKCDSGHLIVLMPFLTGTDAETSIMQVYGVRRIAATARWTHEPIGEFDLVAGQAVAGSGLLYCQSIVLSNGPSLADEIILSPLTDFEDGNATITFHNKGWEFLFFQFNRGASADASNTYVAIM